MIAFTLPVVPPKVTAQQKRVHVVNGKPVFFHGSAMRREEKTWQALMAPYAPATPIEGPVSLSVRLVYPHLKTARKGDRERLLPKGSKPDADNVAKHAIDLLSKLRFIEDDQRVARLTVEKWFGPASLVGIRIQIAPLGAEGESHVRES